MNEASTQFTCPTDDDFEYVDGAFIDPLECNSYYHCINGTFFKRQCPPGLHFTIVQKDCHFSTCVSPPEGNCPDLNNTVFNSELFSGLFHTNPFIDDNLCKENGTFANNTDCTMYYHCYNGEVFPDQCPEGFFFNPNLNVRNCDRRLCVPLDNALCPTGGAWSSWSSWGPCQPECGSGLRVRERKCNNPPPANGGAKCPGSSIDIGFCQNRNCTFDSTPAFFVSYRNSPFVTPGRMRWNSIQVNNKNLYNPNEYQMKVEETGFYFMSISGGSTQGNGFHSVLKNTGRNVALFRQTGGSFNGVDTFSRSGIFSLTSLFNPFTDFETFNTPVFSREDGHETSWLGFKYETDNALFCGSSESEISPGDLRLPEIISLRGFAKVPNTETFRVSRGGWYYINIGIGHAGGAAVDTVLTVNDIPQFNFSVGRSVSNNFQLDQASRGGVVYLEANDNIGLRLLSGRTRSTSGLYTYLTAMKLNATDYTPVFYARRSSNFNEPSEAISYDKVIINKGNDWNSTASEYVVRFSGIYYIEVSGATSVGTRLNIDVNINGSRKFRLLRASNSHNGYDTMSRSGLWKLNEGDTVQFRGSEGLNTNGDRELITATIFVVSG